MRYFGVVSYFGKNFIGWQSQTNKKGVEDKIEKILSHILNTKINIIGAGRTDKGVNAYGQTFHFDVDKEIKDVNHLIYALNRLLPIDIKIKSLKKVDDEFHARFSATKKEYIYKIYTGKDVNFYYLTHMIVYIPIDIKLLKESSKVFIGKHNFQNLTSKEIDDKNFIREIYSISVNKKDDEILIKLVGNGFMRYMVRDIVGEMIEVAAKRKDIKDLDKLFSKTRKITNHKADAQGLYLNKVYYE